MKTLIAFYFILLCGWTCAQETATVSRVETLAVTASDSLLYQRFIPPLEYKRIKISGESFANYLRSLRLKPPGSPVLRFDGTIKSNHNVYDAVVDLPIGDKDLHQCADAVMRLRGEYLWRSGQYDKIHFNLTNGFQVDYLRWKNGERVQVNGNKTEWVKTAIPSHTYATFWKYMEFVFTYAGTLSLSKELQLVQPQNMEIGDVFIRGGSPGHAVIVVDMAVDSSGKKVFMLAQSYMPAQEIQILKNPSDPELSPWYMLDEKGTLDTPEWEFEWSQLKRFPGKEQVGQ